MPHAPREKFEATALASGLVKSQDIEQALESLRAEQAHGDKGPDHYTAEQLAAKLIEFGRINFWQAEQLFAGKRIFHLGPYRILDKIGRGGMGEVYKGEHNLMRRVVAIKVLPHHKATENAISDFLREIQALAQLDHENLVRAYDAGEDNGVYYLATEYVPGQDLRKLVRRTGTLTMRRAAAVIAQAARGLDHAHRRNLIHRDIKPGNLLVTPEGKCKVSDLGLAGHFTDEEPQSGESSRKIVGTADYLAPELILNPDKLTPSTDIYALGCTLYYAVTGKVPFPGGNTSDKARAHLTVHPLDPRRLNPRLADEFVDVIATMMVKDPAGRIATAADVADRLSPWANLPEEMEAELSSEAEAAHATGFTTTRGGGEPIDVGDTRPVLDEAVYVDALVDEQLSGGSQISQLSQPTWPMAAAGHETSPMYNPLAYPPYGPQPGGESGFGLSRGMLIFIVVGLGSALGVLAATLILMMLS
jgi:serine/threonine protein kinase